MSLRDCEPITVPACASTSPCSKGEIFFAQRFNQSEPGRIDRCGITQRLLCLCCHVWIATFGCGPVSFGAITVMATEHEVGDSIRSSTAPWHLMVKLKCRVALAAIDASVVEFL